LEQCNKNAGILFKNCNSKWLFDENIFVTNEVKDTKNETLTVKELIGPNKKIILVILTYHTYRAMLLFENKNL
jgi:hypothetical protein